MANLRETGGFSINGKWATRIAYEADLESGHVSRVDLRFVIGRFLVAQAQLSRADALEVLGYKNLAAIEEAATERNEATRERIKGELRGRTLHYRQAALPGAQPQSEVNSIEREGLSANKEQAEPAVESSKVVPATEERSSLSEQAETGATDLPAAAVASQEARRLAQSHAIPDGIAQRFLRVDNQFYFPDRSLAFVDRVTSLRAESESLEVVRSLVEIAQARGWEAIRVHGTESFRRLVWREATRPGIPVRGYTPTDMERAEVERETIKRGSPAPGLTQLNEVSRDSPERGHEGAEGPRQKERNQSEGRAPEFVVGKLVEHGPAPYQFDQKKARSYFVKLETPLGSTARWGVDLDRAFAESKTRPQVGDEIGVEFHGARAVTVKADVLDEAGRVIGQREVAKHRNSWVVEKREYFEQRSVRAQALRDERRGKEEIAREHPELAGALATVRIAELFASKNLSTDPDRGRFVKLVRDAMALAVEHEVSVPAPKLRETQPRMPGRDRQRPKAGPAADRQPGREPPAMERA